MRKTEKFANCNERQNRKIQSPLPVHLFIRLITPPAEQIFHFLIEVFATNKHSEHREIPFYFLFCESSRVLFLLWDISVFLKGSWVFQPLNFKTRYDVWESWISTKLYLFSIPVLTKLRNQTNILLSHPDIAGLVNIEQLYMLCFLSYFMTLILSLNK